MGFNNENGRRLVFDIETAPLDEAPLYIESADAPSNYKDVAKIAAYIEEKNAEQLAKCSLDADLCRVVAISVLHEGANPVVVTGDDHSEKLMLEWFWETTKDTHLVGFNCLSFDLPVLLRRSLYLGVKAPLIQIDKYRHPDVTDLMMVLSFNGALKFRGLSFYAKRFGFEVPDAIDGSEVGRAVLEGRWDDIEQHVKADVLRTAHLADRCGYFRVAAGVF